MKLISGRVLALIVVVGACKGKESPTGAGTAKPTVDTVADVAAARLATGASTFGCFAWSARLKSAACIIGERTPADGAYRLAFVGGQRPAVKLDAMIDSPTASLVNATLAEDGYAVLAATTTPLTADSPYDLGSGGSLTWSRKQTDAGGDNQPPTHENKVTARCAGATVSVLRDESEGDDPAVTIRTVGDHAIVELTIHVAREGEQSDHVQTAVVDTTSCKVASSVAPTIPIQ